MKDIDIIIKLVINVNPLSFIVLVHCGHFARLTIEAALKVSNKNANKVLVVKAIVIYWVRFHSPTPRIPSPE